MRLSREVGKALVTVEGHLETVRINLNQEVAKWREAESRRTEGRLPVFNAEVIPLRGRFGVLQNFRRDYKVSLESPVLSGGLIGPSGIKTLQARRERDTTAGREKLVALYGVEISGGDSSILLHIGHLLIFGVVYFPSTRSFQLFACAPDEKDPYLPLPPVAPFVSLSRTEKRQQSRQTAYDA
ncbi:MAG: hypothetical protein V1821_00635 [bacterium]